MCVYVFFFFKSGVSSYDSMKPVSRFGLILHVLDEERKSSWEEVTVLLLQCLNDHRGQ